MKTLHNIYEEIEKDLDQRGFYRICSNETTFKDYMKAMLLQFIDSEIERLNGEIIESTDDSQFALHTDGYNNALEDSITYLQEQRKLIEEKI